MSGRSFCLWARLCRWSASRMCRTGQVAQLVEQGIENPRVGSSILSLATMYAEKGALRGALFCV